MVPWMRTSYRVFVSLAAVVGLSLGGACSSSSNGGFDGDDGGTTHNDGGSGGDSGIPLDDAGDPFCSAQADFQTRCSATTACDRSRLAACSQASAALSDAARAAVAECGVQADCTKSFFTIAGNACTVGKLQNATPTAAQAKVATDYCAACDPTNSGCAAAFFAGSAAPGGAVLLASDDVASQIDSRCIVAGSDAGAAACKSDFVDCAGREFLAATPSPADCGDQ